MINLLPQNQKKSLFKVLLLREVEVSLIGLNIIFAVLIVLLVPVYIVIHNQKQVIEFGLENIKKSESVTIDKSMNSVINDINSKLDIFPNDFTDIYPSKDIIVPLINHKVEGVSITGITYERRLKSTVSTTPQTLVTKPDIEVRGIAKNRLALLAFQKSLEADPHYAVVTVPISDFVKGKDITFSILITTTL